MVEFALIAPLFLGLIFLILEGALYVNAIATVNNATREGARIAALCGSSKAATVSLGGPGSDSCRGAVISKVLANMAILQVDTTGSNPVVSPNLPAVQPGDAACVQVTYAYNYYLNFFLQEPPTVQLSSNACTVAQQ